VLTVPEDSSGVDAERAELTQVVELLTGSELGDWQRDELHQAVASATLGIWRVHGEQTHGRQWSVILKLVGHGHDGHPLWVPGDDPDHWYYWRREPLAYQSGLVSSFSAGLRAPATYLIASRSNRCVALWLEDLRAARPGTQWTVSEYAPAARRLGRAQGEFLVSRPLPAHRWLSRRWLRSYLAPRDAEVPLLVDRAAWDVTLVKRWMPRELARPLFGMHRDQESFLRSLDALAPTLCHLDLHPANLFDTGEETVLIDWSFVGIGAMGEDVGNLVPDSVLDFHVEPDRVEDLFSVVHDGYVAGLRDAGWSGDEELVDLAMRATIAAKYAWIAPAMLRAALDRREILNKRPIEDTFAWWAPLLPFFVRCAEDARRLATNS
jgi:hypothetical protein